MHRTSPPWLLVSTLIVFSSCRSAGVASLTDLSRDAETADTLASAGEIDIADIEPQWMLKAVAYCRGEIAKSMDTPLDRLDPEHVRSCMTAMLPKVNRCESGVRIEVRMEVVIEGSGEVSSVLPVGPSALSEEAYCVADVIIREGRFPHFSKERLIVRYPFRLSY